MSEVEGKILTCDVCGESVFLECTGHREADGGYTRYRTYEEHPEGWNGTKAYGIGTTCPSCSARINDAIAKAIREIKEGL